MLTEESCSLCFFLFNNKITISVEQSSTISSSRIHTVTASTIMKCEVAGGGSVTSPVEGTSGEVASDRLVVAVHITSISDITRVLMNTYPCAELGAKHDYSCITATR